MKNQKFEVLQMAGDESPAHGRLLTGKPPRGWGRVREILAGKAGRKSAVETRLKELLGDGQPERIWFHNIAGGGKWGWSEEMIKIAREHAPVLWTLHDMWALGDSGESYWHEESNVESEKGQRPKNGKVTRCEGSKVAKVCGKDGKYPVTLTAPSKWLAELTQKMTGFECVHLPNPIDLDFFSPGDQAEARRRLGLPEKGRVVLAGADSLQDPRKGFDLLMAAWEKLRPKQVTLAQFGRHGKPGPGQVYLGNLSTDDALLAAYRAADLYIHPARMENAPCTIQESLSCGTPVVAFAVGGIPEMVLDGKTGFLAKEISVKSLQTSLADANQFKAMRRKCRIWAEEAWAPGALVQKLQRVVSGLSSVVGDR